MDVFFETQRGTRFSIEVGFFDTVLEIKEKVEKYQGIPIHKQTLVFNGQVLQDDRDVEYCEILQNSRIQLLIASDNNHKHQIKIEESSTSDKIQLILRISSSKMLVPIEMNVDDTILHLKEKIHEMDSIPIQRLILQSNGGELLDTRSLSECELRDNSEINVNIRPSTGATTTGTKKLKLMVLPKCGAKKIPVELNASDKVGELRKELEKLNQMLHFHLPSDYFFIYKQNVMDDDRSFRWHHVCQGDTIEIFNGSITGGS
ncbi:ubiquitin domain-containing protein 7SL RNA1 [Manihot esculenta]|uniref:Ubiquitin-like domain-containing protein n=1 Tax=Manihot esculenta TaxID=3983 RepID=A0A2C9U8N8_MANES|nr:ubiquitin domain-containing protein 7SL RNA1 [Manihot esculenta]OAY25985.1 hypothetical protein MANES_16G012200v8 [Manihot esculenta]